GQPLKPSKFFPASPQFLNLPPSPCQTQTNEKYVRAAFILHHGSGQRVPDVLITWDHSDCWSNREIVKDLEPVLALGSDCGFGQPCDIVLQRSANSIVIDS